MRTVLSYLLLLSVALSGLTGAVQSVYAYTLADAIVAQHAHQQLTEHDDAVKDDAVSAADEMPCHSAKQPQADTTDHSCCEQAKHKCKGDCCAKHCAASSALLTNELFRYFRPTTVITHHTTELPLWLFSEESPPPINA